MSEIQTNNGTLRRCVSLADGGDLSPDMRVNYTFGLVLGVEEFMQEQCYFLNKDYLHNRALHGYGTVSGLHVKIEPEKQDFKISVEKGIGIDQIGRTFIVNEVQCAHLGAWLNKPPDDAVAHQKEGTKQVFVVASYAECEDKLVPIAGQPCSTSQLQQANSRIRDSAHIELRTERPAMPAWDAVQLFAELMAQVRIVRRLPQQYSSEAAIIELMGLLDRRGQFFLRYTEITHGVDHSEDTETKGAFRPLQLPAEGINDTLDRIFTYWTTQVRPKLKPDLITPFADDKQETAILLTTIEFTYSRDGDNLSIQLAENTPNDQDRPYLLGTQAIQQLMAIGSAGDANIALEFAALNVVDSRNVVVWVHHPDVLEMPAKLNQELVLLVNDNPVNGVVTRLDNLKNVFRIVTDTDIPAGARVELRFNLRAIRIAPEGAAGGEPIIPHLLPIHPILPGLIDPLPVNVIGVVDGVLAHVNRLPVLEPLDTIPNLAERIAAINAMRAHQAQITLYEAIEVYRFHYIGREDNILRVYTFADNIIRLQDLATVQAIPGKLDEIVLLLWLHQTGSTNITSDAIKVARMGKDNYVDLNAGLTRLRNENDQLYIISTTEALKPLDMLRIQIDTSLVTVRDKPLDSRISDEQLAYHGYDGTKIVTLYYVIEQQPSSAGDVNIDEIIRRITTQVEADLQKQSATLRTLPFATITAQQTDDVLGAELWFHIDLQPFGYDAAMKEIDLRVFVEMDDALQELSFELQRNKKNVYQALFTKAMALDDLLGILAKSPYLRFIFSLGKTTIVSEDRTRTLAEFMADYNVRFDGNYVEDAETRALVIYVRWPDKAGGKADG